MYQVNSAIREWFEKAKKTGGGVPCVQCEAQFESEAKAIAFAQDHAGNHPEEVVEVREFPGGTCVWVSA